MVSEVGKLLTWIQTFLVGRRQQVQIEGCSMEWKCVSSGILQGSVLEPILFMIGICQQHATRGLKLYEDVCR